MSRVQIIRFPVRSGSNGVFFSFHREIFHKVGTSLNLKNVVTNFGYLLQVLHFSAQMASNRLQ